MYIVTVSASLLVVYHKVSVKILIHGGTPAHLEEQPIDLSLAVV